MSYVYHLARAQDWQRLTENGADYVPESIATEGFIHLSTAQQLLVSARRFYREVSDLQVVVVDQEAISDKLRYEQADGESFPHLYGALPLTAVVEIVRLPWQDDDFRWPVALDRYK